MTLYNIPNNVKLNAFGEGKHRMGPQTEAADAIHKMKYRGEGEDFREAANRWAFGLKDSDEHYHALRHIFLDMRFCMGGRIQGAIGATRQTTPFNCYVSGTIADSFVEGPGSIMARAHEAAATMRMGGGIGYDFSTLRPKGSLIRKLQSHSTGPISFMRIFNEVCLATSSSGHRRGAQMGVLRVDHPDIETFVRAKQNSDQLTGFNISVAITDAFMEAVAAGRPFDLTWGGEVHRTIDAATLWEAIMRSTWDWAEPGVIFIDTANRMNNLWYTEVLAATNPCGEQPLPPFGACLLGSFNLVKYLVRDPLASTWSFDWDLLKADIPIVCRGMDNVIDRALYPLAEQRAEAFTKRRMGLGVMGLANAGEALGHHYGSTGFLEFEGKVLEVIRDELYRASALLAKEKGPFKLFDAERYLKGEFVRTLPEDVRDLIATHGIRNSHLTSIAPTGTISMCADNVSSGVEPPFSRAYQRPINTPDGPVTYQIEDYGSKFLGVDGRLSDEVTAREHVDVLTTAQRYVDSAVSKTCNVTGAMPWEDFKGIYQRAWEAGAKGCTTFRQDGQRGALLTQSAPAPAADATCRLDPVTGERSCE